MTASLPAKKYDIIYADPPWRYTFAVENRKIENHYPTMEVLEICNVQVPSAENSILFLWGTAPKLLEALEVMKAWGFEYKTNAVWDKKRIGMGYYFRGQHEHLLVGIKGEFIPPEVNFRNSSIYREKRTEHSVKPAFFRTWIAEAYPLQSKLEMFARERIEGWDAWGNEIPPHTQLQLHEVTS